MNDIEKFIKFYKQFGIKINQPRLSNQEDRLLMILPDDVIEGQEKFEGHNRFTTVIEFNLSGTFLTQGFWE